MAGPHFFNTAFFLDRDASDQYLWAIANADFRGDGLIGKKAGLALAIIILVGLFPVYQFISSIFSTSAPDMAQTGGVESPAFQSIESSIEPGETLMAVFIKHGLQIEDLFAMRQAAASVHRLRYLHPGQPYRFTIDQDKGVHSFIYGINDNTILKIERAEEGFRAEKSDIPYESRVLTLGGQIEDSLMAALGNSREDVALAISISDILAWDIDFNTDLRKNDSFRIIVEGMYLEGEFKKYGKILAVEFINDGRVHKAYLFDQNGRMAYFDSDGKSLKKAFLKAPLSFRRVSSSFSRSRRHPILKINRPHHGIDYVAPSGTPVSATADGRIAFAGRRGAYGNLVILTHRNGMQTYYGHLSRIAPGRRAGKQVMQGDLVGYVGSTGLSSGPHLHYEMRQNSRPINPTQFKMEAGDPVLRARMDDFKSLTSAVDQTFTAAIFHDAKDAESLKKARALASKAGSLPPLN
jgi:murein DD-endopeptidase MepM/ murein hydrolase activator NlpD